MVLLKPFIFFGYNINKLKKGVRAMSEKMTSAISTAFTGVKTDVLDVMETALPVALAIVGVGLAIVLGVKFFKKISSKA